jgi:hypothetical protein
MLSDSDIGFSEAFVGVRLEALQGRLYPLGQEAIHLLGRSPHESGGIDELPKFAQLHAERVVVGDALQKIRRTTFLLHSARGRHRVLPNPLVQILSVSPGGHGAHQDRL